MGYGFVDHERDTKIEEMQERTVALAARKKALDEVAAIVLMERVRYLEVAGMVGGVPGVVVQRAEEAAEVLRVVLAKIDALIAA